MRSTCFACVVVVVVAAALVSRSSSLPQRERGSCAFGSEYKDGCNHCICHGNSGSTCTRLPNCTFEPVIVDSSGRRIVTSPPSLQKISTAVQRGHCNLGIEFRKDCNICTCQGELGYICTKKECTDYKSGSDRISASAEYPESPTPPTETKVKGRCILGHRFFRGCDLCTCFGEYFGYRCAKMENCREQAASITYYPTTRLPTSYEKQMDNCPLGLTYHDGYYFCKCRPDSKGYVCKNSLSSD